jgi:heptosyltransferase-2
VNHPVKILLIRFSSIGDIMLTTPIIRCLKKQLEGEVELHYLTKTAYGSLLQQNPHIHQVHTIQKSTAEVSEALLAEGFDYVIDLHKNLRSWRVKRSLRSLSFTFHKLNWKKWLLVNFKQNRLPELHLVDRYFKAVEALGVKNDGQGLDYFLPEKTPFKSTFEKGAYIALVLSATHATKRPTFAMYRQLIAGLDMPVVLIGGKAEKAEGQQLRKTAARPGLVENHCGQCSLHESALLIKEARAVITPDTGMMHIAAAFEKDIYSLWGNTVPEFGMYPYLPATSSARSEIFEVKGLSCRPCSKIGYSQCPKGHFKCMNELVFDFYLP